MENIYIIDNLSFFYKKKKILKEMSFSVRQGDIIGLLGPNGAGKSTLVNLLTGVMVNYTGNIFFKQSPIRNNELEVKSNVSAILDRSATYDSITVEQNIIYYSKLLGAKVSQGEKLLDDFELTPYKRYKVQQLSSGFRQRLKIVIALLNNPSVIFLDEPWLALDPINSRFLSKKIIELNEVEGITFIIAAHELDELDALCSRFLFIESGQMILNFPKGKHPTFDVVFIDDAAFAGNSFAELSYFKDTKHEQYILINPTEKELNGIRQIERKHYTLKDLYFEVLT